MNDIQGLMLAMLVRDFGYTEAPTYGDCPLRHQFAWIEATRGLSPAQVIAEVAERVADANAEGEVLPDPWARGHE